MSTITDALDKEIDRLLEGKLLERITHLKDQIKDLKSQLKKAEDRQSQKESKIIEIQTHLDGINNNPTD